MSMGLNTMAIMLAGIATVGVTQAMEPMQQTRHKWSECVIGYTEPRITEDNYGEDDALVEAAIENCAFVVARRWNSGDRRELAVRYGRANSTRIYGFLARTRMGLPREEAMQALELETP